MEEKRERETGTIRWYCGKRRFGFIVPDAGEPAIFFSGRELTGGDKDRALVNTTVEFLRASHPKGTVATGIVVTRERTQRDNTADRARRLAASASAPAKPATSSSAPLAYESYRELFGTGEKYHDRADRDSTRFAIRRTANDREVSA